MCLPLIAQVQSVEGSIAEIRLLEGQITTVNTTLTPDVKDGAYVLVDRGMSIETGASRGWQRLRTRSVRLLDGTDPVESFA